MFALLAALSTLVILPLLVWCVPETLQYKVLQRLGREQPAVSKIAEAQSILGRVSTQNSNASIGQLHCMLLRLCPCTLTFWPFGLLIQVSMPFALSRLGVIWLSLYVIVLPAADCRHGNLVWKSHCLLPPG